MVHRASSRKARVTVLKSQPPTNQPTNQTSQPNKKKQANKQNKTKKPNQPTNQPKPTSLPTNKKVHLTLNGTTEMSQQVKVFATEPNGQSSIPGIYMIIKRQRTSASCPLTSPNLCTHMNTHENTHRGK